MEFCIVMTQQAVIERIRNNWTKHVEEYNEQMAGYKAAMEDYTKQLNEWAQAGKSNKERPEEPFKPRDYSGDYEKLLAVFEAHEADRIELFQEQIEKVVHDEFIWKQQFIQTSGVYNVNR